MSNKEAPRGHSRLHINCADDTMQFLQRSASRNSTTLTETVRRAATALMFIEESLQPGETLAIVTLDGKKRVTSAREVLVLG